MLRKQKFIFLMKFNSAITYKGEFMFVCKRQLVEIEIEVKALARTHWQWQKFHQVNSI